MVEIDLHGLKHKEVEDTLESMLISYYNLGSFPIRVITGHSHKMKKLLSNTQLKQLSMGMSNDYLEAIDYNSTFVRIGSKIFGERN